MSPVRDASRPEEPRPLEGPILFEESDFRALVPPLASNPDYNAHRLAARRRLLALGKRCAAASAELSKSDSLLVTRNSRLVIRDS